MGPDSFGPDILLALQRLQQGNAGTFQAMNNPPNPVVGWLVDNVLPSAKNWTGRGEMLPAPYMRDMSKYSKVAGLAEEAGSPGMRANASQIPLEVLWSLMNRSGAMQGFMGDNPQMFQWLRPQQGEVL